VLEFTGTEVADARLDVLPSRKMPPEPVAEADAGAGVFVGSEDIVVEITGTPELVANAGSEAP
jgi:hypothetical protein